MERIDPSVYPWARRFEKIWNTYVRLPLLRQGSLSAAYWEKQSVGDPHGPDKFVAMDPLSPPLLEDVAARLSGPDSPVLDLGCNAGRNLSALFQKGFKNLHGVDVQREAFEHMKRVFPEMHAAARLHQATYQAYLPTVADGAFDVVYSQAAVEFVSPAFPLVRHLARIARRAVVLLVNEGGHNYPRLWEVEFARSRFFLTKLLRPALAGEAVSLMVFRPAP